MKQTTMQSITPSRKSKSQYTHLREIFSRGPHQHIFRKIGVSNATFYGETNMETNTAQHATNHIIEWREIPQKSRGDAPWYMHSPPPDYEMIVDGRDVARLHMSENGWWSVYCRVHRKTWWPCRLGWFNDRELREAMERNVEELLDDRQAAPRSIRLDDV
jgi:hypothetical protein